MVVFTLVGGLVPSSDLLDCLLSVVGCCWLLLHIQQPVMAVHQGRRSRLLTIRLVDWQRRATVSIIIYTYNYILYLRHEYTVLVILCMGLPITTTVTLLVNGLNSSLYSMTISNVLLLMDKQLFMLGQLYIT